MRIMQIVSGTTIVFKNGPPNNGWKVSAEVSVPYPVELTVCATCSQLTNSTLS
jgi:NMD protein affecting ribosome stability and mRNA decay